MHRVLLPADGTAPSTARVAVAAALDAMHLEHLLDAVELAVSELVTNAVLHARTPIDLVLRAHGNGVRVEVTDRSSVLPAQRSYGGFATTGRGLALVSRLARNHGVELGAGGKTVWFELDGSEVTGSPDEQPDLLAAWDAEDQLLAGRAQTAHVRVTLPRLPVRLWMATQQHDDALLRELGMQRHATGAESATEEGAEVAHAAIAAAVAIAVARQPKALVVDVELALEPGTAHRFAALRDALDRAEALAAGGLLLAMPGLPEVVALRDWACTQVRDQAGGASPTPWRGTDLDLFTHAVDRFLVPAVLWDPTPVTSADHPVVAGDDHNRIVAVSGPAAALLGWDADDLVGRRVVTLVPPHLREAHLAGFARHLSTGEDRVIGVPLQLPVLHRDGHEIVCGFLVERAPGTDRRVVYQVHLEPIAGP